MFVSSFSMWKFSLCWGYFTGQIGCESSMCK